MKAAVVTSPGNLVVKEIPDPVTGPYDVLCRTLATAVCSGTDTHMIAGHPYFEMVFPAVLGHEGIGQVIRCGEKVRNFDIGDRITRIHNKLPGRSGYTVRYGAFAELSTATDWKAMRADGLSEELWAPLTVHRRLPKDIDPLAATIIVTWRETSSFLRRMGPENGDSVLIIGSGANALSFADHSRILGLNTVVVGNVARSMSFERTGAVALISYRTSGLEAALERTGAAPFDLIIDTIGNPAALNPLIGLLKDGGKIGIYGLDAFNDYHVHFSGARGDFSCFSGEIYDEGSAHDHVMAALSAGQLNPWPYLSKDHVYPLADINEAVRACSERLAMKSVVSFL